MILDRIVQFMLFLSLVLLLLATGFLLLAFGAVIPGFLDELFILGLLILAIQWLFQYRDASGKENFFVREFRKIYLAAVTKELRGRVIDCRHDRGYFVIQDNTRAYRFPLKSLSEQDRMLLDDLLDEEDEVLIIINIHLLTRSISHYEFPQKN